MCSPTKCSKNIPEPPLLSPVNPLQDTFKNPSENLLQRPSQNLRTPFSEAFLEACVAVRPLRRGVHPIFAISKHFELLQRLSTPFFSYASFFARLLFFLRWYGLTALSAGPRPKMKIDDSLYWEPSCLPESPGTLWERTSPKNGENSLSSPNPPHPQLKGSREQWWQESLSSLVCVLA